MHWVDETSENGHHAVFATIPRDEMSTLSAMHTVLRVLSCSEPYSFSPDKSVPNRIGVNTTANLTNKSSGMFLGCYPELVVGNAVPDFFHLDPIHDNTVFDGVLQDTVTQYED